MTLPVIDVSTLFGVAGKSALVVGATGAFGKVVCATVGNAGAKLTIAAGNAGELATLQSELRARHIDATIVAKRPNSEDDCGAMTAAAVAAYGRIDILVVASGMNDVAPIVEMTPELSTRTRVKWSPTAAALPASPAPASNCSSLQQTAT